MLDKPKWEDVYNLIHDNMLRDYRIDIETNSTLSADTDEDKQNVTEAVTAMSNMFNAFAPAVEKGAITMPVMKQMTLAVVRRFNFGRMLEDAVNAMPDQLPDTAARLVRRRPLRCRRRMRRRKFASKSRNRSRR